jgi:hypothetical protein
MQSSISEGDRKGVPAQLEALGNLRAEELHRQWQVLFGSDSPARIRGPLMIQALAYRLQEKTFGGLRPSTRRLLARIACDAGERRPLSLAPKPKVKLGGLLIREWHGIRHQVTAVKDGFMYRGRPYRSLSKIATEITGSRWSGPLFFGLKPSRQEQHRGAA